MQAANKYRHTDKGLPDLLNYAAVVDDGIIATKDGSLLAGWFYRGADNHSATAAELNYQAVHINHTFKELGSGWMLHIDSVRMPAREYDLLDRSHFTDRVSRAIERERMNYFSRQGNSYESVYIMVATYQPPLGTQKKATDLFFDDGETKEEKKNKPKKGTQSVIESFKEKIGDLEGHLSQCISMQRMRGIEYTDEFGDTHVNDQLLSYIHRCITGETHGINLPPVPMYLDALLGRSEFQSGLTPVVGDKYVLPVSIDGFPHEAVPGILQILDTVNAEYRWSTRFIFLDSHEAITELHKYRKKWRQKVRGLVDQVFNTSKGTINTDALNMSEQAEAAINDVESGDLAYGYYTTNLIFMDKDLAKLQGIAKQVVNRLNALGFPASIETVNANEAYLGSLPGHSKENVRRPMLSTFNLAHLMPTSSIWAGEENCPCPFYPSESPPLMHCATHGSTPFRLNLHVGDLGHTLMFGPTGAGKSTSLATIAAQFRRYPNASIFAFDKGRSMMPLCMAANGDHYNIASEKQTLAFSPMSHVKGTADIAWFQDWIETILKLQGVNPTPAQRGLIAQAIRGCLKTGSKSISDLIVSVQDMEIKAALESYAVGGTFGHLLDAEEDGLSVSDFSVFEIEDLMNLDDKVRLPILLYLFWRIEKQLHGQPALLILDEAWLMLGHPVFREKIREWLKVLRKANCLVLLATQSISDAVNSGILDVLLESTATKIYLPNPEANTEETYKLYKKMGLNDREIAMISKARKKREYYLVSENGRRMFEFALGPIALAFVGVSDKEQLATVEKMVAEHGESWPEVWLKHNGISTELLSDVA